MAGGRQARCRSAATVPVTPVACASFYDGEARRTRDARIRSHDAVAAGGAAGHVVVIGRVAPPVAGPVTYGNHIHAQYASGPRAVHSSRSPAQAGGPDARPRRPACGPGQHLGRRPANPRPSGNARRSTDTAFLRLRNTAARLRGSRINLNREGAGARSENQGKNGCVASSFLRVLASSRFKSPRLMAKLRCSSKDDVSTAKPASEVRRRPGSNAEKAGPSATLGTAPTATTACPPRPAPSADLTTCTSPCRSPSSPRSAPHGSECEGSDSLVSPTGRYSG